MDVWVVGITVDLCVAVLVGNGVGVEVGLGRTVAVREGFSVGVCVAVGVRVRVSELRKSTTEARLIWVKPNKFRAEVITATNPLLEGGAMATMDGQNITARAKGLLGLIPFKLNASDDKLSTNRNHTFTENNPNSHLARLTAANAVWTILGDSMVDRVPVKMIAVDNVRRLDNQITREILAVEPRTLKLYGLTMYAGNKRVVDNKFLKFAWNPRVGTEKFSL